MTGDAGTWDIVGRVDLLKREQQVWEVTDLVRILQEESLNRMQPARADYPLSLSSVESRRAFLG